MSNDPSAGQSAPPSGPGLAARMYNREERVEYERMQYVANLFMPSLMAQMRVVSDVTMIFFGWFSITAEVFMRGDFGERYLNTLRLFSGFIVLCLLGIGGYFWGVAALSEVPAHSFDWIEKAPPQWLPHWFAQLIAWGMTIDFTFIFIGIAYLLLCVIHRGTINARNRRGEKWHSMSFGVSVAEVLFEKQFAKTGDADWAFYRYWEPASLLGAAIVVAFFTYSTVYRSVSTGSPYVPVNGWTTSFWLLLCSASFYVRNQIAYTEFRDRVLNIVDAQIEAEMFQPSLHGQSKRQTAGFSVVHFPPAQMKEVETAIHAIRPDIADTIAARVQAVTGEKPTGDGEETGEKKKDAA